MEDSARVRHGLAPDPSAAAGDDHVSDQRRSRIPAAVSMTDVPHDMLPPPSFAMRWMALAAMSCALFGSYYAFDSISPLAMVLSRQLHFSDYQIGLLQASYSFPNIFALLIAGYVIDRIGARKSMLAFGILTFLGLTVTSLTPKIVVMVMGRMLVGLGSEALAMASHVAIARWFMRSELMLAFALRSSVCRLGSLTAQTSPTWATAVYRHWRWPLLLSLGFGVCCVAGTALYWWLDVVGEREFTFGSVERSIRFKPSELLRFNRSFWLLAGICIFFYSCTFPFQTFGQQFFINTRHESARGASLLVGMEPLFSLCLMPVFGFVLDRFGRRALSMIIGSLILLPVFLILAYTRIPSAIPMAMMGIAFSLVPSVLWMSVILVVDHAKLGFASALVDSIQQLGLVGANLLIGWSNDRWLASAANPEGYRASMWIFTGFAALSLAFSIALRRVERGPKAQGLETIHAVAPISVSLG